MRPRVPRFGIFFMVVLIVMGLGLLFMGESADDEDEKAPSTTLQE